MEFLIEDVFKLLNGRIVFACKITGVDAPKGSKFEAFIRQRDSEQISAKFSVFPELMKLTPTSRRDLIGFATSGPVEVDMSQLRAKPHFLVLQ
jgi:hypothetical protein